MGRAIHAGTLILLAVLLYFSFTVMPSQKKHVKKPDPDSMYRMYHVIKKSYNEKGQITEELEAHALKSFRRPLISTVFFKPKVVLFNHLSKTVIVSDIAYTKKDDPRYFFVGHVNIDHHDTPGKSFHLTSTEMCYWKEEGIAKTNDIVTIHKPQMTMNGEGAVVNLKTSHIQIIKNSRTAFRK